jgi:hypothetical protein
MYTVGIIIYIGYGVAMNPKPKSADRVGANSKALQPFKRYLMAFNSFLNRFNCFYNLCIESILDLNPDNKTAFKPA